MIDKLLYRARRASAWAYRCATANTPYNRSLRALLLSMLPGTVVLARNSTRSTFCQRVLGIELSSMAEESLIRMSLPNNASLFTPAGSHSEVNWIRCWELLYDHWLHCCVLDQYFAGEYIKPGMTVLDIGANVGAFSLAAARLVGDSGSLLMIEPNPDNLRALKRFLSMNSLPESSCVIGVAAGPNDGSTTFWRGHARTGMGTTLSSRATEQAEAINVDLRSIDSIVDEFELHPDFIKIDVEGAESGVLAGASNTLRRCRPIVATAAYHRPGDTQAIARIISETAGDYQCCLRIAALGTEPELIAVPREREVECGT